MELNELKKILEQHSLYLETRGSEGVRAYLRFADLRDANLRNANLRNANLYGADLRNADLRGADLYDANLYDADLCGADLCDAGLYDAGLYDANLRGANLYSADLYGADLRNADLRDANLYDADLRNADLRNADLRGANLRGANLCGADLRGANLQDILCNETTSGYWMVCPESGSFIGYKKAYIYKDDSVAGTILVSGKVLCFSSEITEDTVIVKLQVPASAKRSSATTRKCRVSKAKVLSIESIDGKTKYEKANSGYDKRFIYNVGETVKVDDFDLDRWNECSTGIHLFMTRKEAEIY